MNRINIDASAILIAVGGIAAIGAIGYLYAKRDELIRAVNPASSDNIINRGVTSIVRNVTDDENQTLGGILFDFVHPAAEGVADTYYRVMFPDGVHAVHAPDISADGLVSRDGQVYRIGYNGAGERIAIPQ